MILLTCRFFFNEQIIQNGNRLIDTEKKLRVAKWEGMGARWER